MRVTNPLNGGKTRQTFTSSFWNSARPVGAPPAAQPLPAPGDDVAVVAAVVDTLGVPRNVGERPPNTRTCPCNTIFIFFKRSFGT